MVNAEYVNSYYAHTVNRQLSFPALAGEIRCDVCVVGGGFTGLSSAIHLARQGYDVVLLEGTKIGWGASGRNGGQAIIGYNTGIGALERQYGLAAAQNFLECALEGRQIIDEFMDEFAIDCDLKPGHVGLATGSDQLRAMEHEQMVWARCGHDAIQVFAGRDAVKERLNSDRYVGGYYDPHSAHLHPLNLALGEAAGLQSLGGRIYEGSRVTRIEPTMRPRIHTEHGTVNAQYVVLAGNAYLGNLVPSLEAKIIPVSTFIIATERLEETLARRLIKQDYAYTDWNYVLDYYRLTADKRLLFGGTSYYGGREPKRVGRTLHNNMTRVFPELKDVAINFTWGGNFAITYSRMPDVGRLPNANVFYAQGYSGHGVTTTHIVGRLLAEAISGTAERFDVFANLKQVPMPGGKLFKVPAVMMGSWYYRLRDKLGASRK